MAHAYTPGLRVTRYTELSRERRLPLKGQVVVQTGAKITAETIVARTDLPGNVQTVNVANALSVLPEEVGRCMLKPIGGAVAEGEVIAMNATFFGLFKARVKAPVAGTIETVSNVTGQVILREAPIPVQVHAYVDGVVAEVLPGEGVRMETAGAFVQGIFGIGGETWGEVKVLVSNPDEILTRDHVKGDLTGKIVVGGSLVTSEVLEASRAAGARAVVVGGFNDQDLRSFLGYDLGVAITGSEEKGITLVVTEGFGRMRMADRTFELFKEVEGKHASVSGATQIRAGVIRPEIIVPLDTRPAVAAGGGEVGQGMAEGSPVRVIREPFFGRLGRVASLPPELQPLETEAHVRVLTVEFADGKRVTLPRANVEMIES
jgi:hypothetical protein